jgi:xylan 1,4-beta-xylosidase
MKSSGYRAQGNTFTNPILRGGYPDPSICRVGDDYYLVDSSFEYFPGLPIHHSKDLINWELVGYGLHREDQCAGDINLVDVQTKGGIHAPSIRFHNGMFYIITTNVYLPEGQSTQCINFILTANNIAGPWSEPHILAGVPGIDPDIFFDDNGKVWYVGTNTPDKPNFEGEGEIWLQEVDLNNWRLKGERYYLWRGACGGVWAEGPHIFKKNERCYLMIAEGGTSFNHAVMISVSEKITGPYISNPRNPILSSRQLSYDHWVNSTGHADLVELPDGRWYMVALGIRGDEDRGSNMGRETHLIPVVWEREPFEWQEVKYEWPVCAPVTGRVERNNQLPLEGTRQVRDNVFKDHFDSPTLNLEWNFHRVPMPDTFSLNARGGYLRLFAKPEIIKERARCSFMGTRQKESDFEYSANMEFFPKSESGEAGISLFQQDDAYLNFTLLRQDGQYLLRLVLAERINGSRELRKEILSEYKGKIIFRIVSKNHYYRYEYSLDNGFNYAVFSETKANLILSRGYTGAYLGIYATSNSTSTQEYADFDWVRCEVYPKD